MRPWHFTLVVVPNLATRLRENGLDREHEAHLLRLEDTALWIDKRNALTLKYKARLQVIRGQGIVGLAKPSDMIESRDRMSLSMSTSAIALKPCLQATRSAQNDDNGALGGCRFYKIFQDITPKAGEKSTVEAKRYFGQCPHLRLQRWNIKRIPRLVELGLKAKGK